MIEEMIQRAFEIRNASHLQHWKTKSYAQHKALGNFYEDLIEITDKYVEAYQGGVKLIGKIEGEKSDIIKAIEEQMLWLSKNRSQLAQDIPALENILDEMVGLYLKTLYKLENLR